MNKKICTLLFLFFVLHTLKAQDTLFLKIGIQIPCKVLQVSDTVYYHMQGSKESDPALRMRAYDISAIHYANGSVFSYETKTRANAQQINVKLGYCITNLTSLLHDELTLQGISFAVGYTSKAFGWKKKIRMEGGIGFVQRGGFVGTAVNGPGSSYPFLELIRLDYYASDLCVRYYPIHYIYFKAGLGAAYREAFIPEQPALYKSSDFKPFSAGIVYGAGIQSNPKRVGVLLEFLIQKDFTTLGFRSPDGITYRGNSFLINLGMFFNLGSVK
jgi:hypothetical protein